MCFQIWHQGCIVEESVPESENLERQTLKRPRSECWEADTNQKCKRPSRAEESTEESAYSCSASNSSFIQEVGSQPDPEQSESKSQHGRKNKKSLSRGQLRKKRIEEARARGDKILSKKERREAWEAKNLVKATALSKAGTRPAL